jgi:protein-tyrosine phosphatase
MPGRFEPLETFLEAITTANVSKVLCLVADGEIAGKSPDYLAMIRRGEFPVKLWRFDIPDYGMPENVDDLDLMLDRIRECLEQGESVVIHCAAGHGRTGLVATLLLVRMGLPLDMATETIGLAGSAPDTVEQQKFLEQRAANYRRNQEQA